jgi:leader peptidase (prepilin peptidase)/N-methyltransferase
MTRIIKAVMVSPISRWVQALSFWRSVRRLATPAVWTKLLLGVVAVGAVYVSMVSAPGTIGFLAAGLALVMLAIAVIDWRSFIIPNWLNAIGFGLALMHAAAQEPEAILQAVAMAAMRGAALALIFLALRYLYAQFRGRQGLGLGDVKLALVAGAWLDWLIIPIAIELATFAALSAYLWRQFTSGRPISATNRMPFGLFFAPTIWICWLLEARWLNSF